MSKLGDLIQKAKGLGLRPVLGAGNPSSKLWICGESPGENEEIAGKPFAAGYVQGYPNAGYLLDPVLELAKINRKQCYVTNVSPVRPPENKWELLERTGITQKECTDALTEQIEIFQPNAILALGNHALVALTHNSGITEWRGIILQVKRSEGEHGDSPNDNEHILSSPGSKVIPSFHPAHILRMGDKTAKKEREGKGGIKYTYGSARTTLILDCKRAKREAEFKGIRVPERDLRWGLSAEENESWLRQFSNAPIITFDIETKGKFADIIAFSVPRGVAVSMPTSTTGVRELLLSHKGLIAQNASFDMTILKRNDLPVGQVYADSMIAHHDLYSELPHDLSYLASVYCDMTELLHPPNWDAPENRGRYNALHAAITGEVWLRLAEEMKEVGYI